MYSLYVNFVRQNQEDVQLQELKTKFFQLIMNYNVGINPTFGRRWLTDVSWNQETTELYIPYLFTHGFIQPRILLGANKIDNLDVVVVYIMNSWDLEQLSIQMVDNFVSLYANKLLPATLDKIITKLEYLKLEQ